MLTRVIGFLICFREKRNYDLTRSWRDAAGRATEMVQRSPKLNPLEGSKPVLFGQRSQACAEIVGRGGQRISFEPRGERSRHPR